MSTNPTGVSSMNTSLANERICRLNSDISSDIMVLASTSNMKNIRAWYDEDFTTAQAAVDGATAPIDAALVSKRGSAQVARELAAAGDFVGAAMAFASDDGVRLLLRAYG